MHSYPFPSFARIIIPLKPMSKTCTLILLSLVVAAAPVAAEVAPEGNIRMREGAPFKIALFADLHFGEDAWTEWGPRQDANSITVMSIVLDKEQPDFVIYLGDVITANNIMTKNASLYWNQAVSPTRNRGVPWASVFGNHDDASFDWPLDWFSEIGIPKRHCSSSPIVSFSGNLASGSSESECSFRGTTRLELMRNEIEQNRLCYSEEGPEYLWPSVSNYVLKLSSSSSSEEVVAYMYFFDSGGGSYPEVISNAQVKWFQKKSEEVNPHLRVPEIIFWHIPSKAYKEVDPRSDGKTRCVGSIFLEDVAAQEAEMGIMEVFEQRDSVKAIFVGHNHGLDWCCPYKKQLWLCFGRHTGYGGYGNWSRGARILEITQQPFCLKSWIRMEDGQTHSEVLLSS